MTTDFSRVLASIQDAGDGSLYVVVPPDWLQGRTVFGGMQMAIAVRGMRSTMPEQARSLPLRSVQMTFVGPLTGGDSVQLRSELLRPGRSITHVRAGTDGYLSQTSVLYGPDGHAYSVSHQTVGVFA